MRLFIIFILLGFFSHAQNECGTASGYTGTLYEKYANGGTREQNVYVNGVKHGICSTYYLDGTLRSQVKYNLGKADEILKKPDPEHDANDNKILNPPPNYEYKTYNNPGPTKWTSQSQMLNDSTKLLKSYWDGRLFMEQKFVKNIEKWRRTYFLENEALSIYGHYNGNVEYTYFGSSNHYKYKTWFNNGNIKEEHEYIGGHETGVGIIYYNNSTHTIKSVTRYNDGYDYNIRDAYNNGLKSKTRFFDTTGKFISYETNFGRMSKHVSFTDNIEELRWEGHLWGDSVSGIVENGVYKIRDVYSEDGKRKVKKGNGKLKKSYGPVIDKLFYAPDTTIIPSNLGKKIVWRGLNQESNGAVGSNVKMMSNDYCYNYENSDMFYVPGVWQGEVRNGFLEGIWQAKEKLGYYVYDGVEAELIYQGHYENSLRQGIWTYEREAYKYYISYNNGKKEGKVKFELKPKPQDKKLVVESYGDFRDGESFFVKQNSNIWIGSFKNDEMDGEWICYYKFPDQIAFKVVFENGKYIGKTEEYNLKQQLVYRATIVKDKISNEKFYTPFGEEYDKKNLLTEPYNNVYHLKESDSNGKVKRELTWNNYNGWIFTNCTYIDGKRSGEWILTYDAVVQTVNYKNDTIDGSYKYERNTWRGKDSTIGNYSMGKKIGEWVTAEMEDSSFKKEVYMDDECFLITYKKGNTQFVTNGNGVVTEIAEGLQIKTEQYYKSGEKYKTVLIYINTNQIASIEYHTERGDSLAYYMPPETGTCVKNGTGMKTTLDERKRIAAVDYYKNGKLIKKDVYSEGVFYRTYYFHLISDTSSSSGTKPVIEKIITKPSDEDAYYNVTIKIRNIPKNASAIYIGEGYEFNINKGEQMKIINGEAYRTGSNVNQMISLIPKQPFNKNFIEIQYKGSIHSSLLKSNAQVLIYTIDKKSYNIDARYPITD